MFDIFFSQILPTGLMLMMVGMGLSLDLGTFRRVIEHPRAAILGLGAQLVLLPLAAFLLVAGFGLVGSIALGLILLSACPGGITSNALTFVVKGDVALSVTLTAFNSLAVIFTLPLIFALGSQWLLTDGPGSVEVPVGMLMQQLAVLTLMPVALGMTLRRVFPNFANRSEIWIRRFTVALLVLMFFAVLISEFDFFLTNALQMGSLVIALMALTMGVGYGLSRLFKLPSIQRLTILIEVGIQNTVVAVYLATNVLEDASLALVPSTYGILMLFVVVLAIPLARRT